MSKLISKDDFIKLFDNYDITISDSDYSRFEAYADLLCEWNEKINLTAITDPEGISIKHFFDSVYPFTLFEVKENATVIDVGTGAGFPSCPPIPRGYRTFSASRSRRGSCRRYP